MATISLGAPRRGRALHHDLPLVPFIDFLLCLIAFLLVTAVWSQMARLEATANARGTSGLLPSEPAPELHVRTKARSFELSWYQGSTLLERTEVAKVAGQKQDGDLSYPALAEAVEHQWRARGAHRAPTDPVQDRAVVHFPNSAAFAELAAVLDALHAPKRPLERGDAARPVRAFAVSLASD